LNHRDGNRPGGDDWNRLAPEGAATLDRADELEVPSLDPMKPTDKSKDDFHGYKVLGETTVRKDDRKAILDGLKAGLKESDGGLADTFTPRHGLRATHDGKHAGSSPPTLPHPRPPRGRPRTCGVTAGVGGPVSRATR